MKIAIMQPYFFPYIGYWQLINSVDKFVVYDNIKFTKNSWIRRNRILVNGSDKLITLPIKQGSDYLDIRERYLAETFSIERQKILNQIKEAYKNAPHYSSAIRIIEKCICNNNNNLFDYIYFSILELMNYLKIDTEVIISSKIDMDHTLHNKFRVLEICKVLGAEVYINPCGGTELYNKDEFKSHGVELKFIKSNNCEYKQFNNVFIPSLSIIDVLMFNDFDKIQKMLSDYTFF